MRQVFILCSLLFGLQCFAQVNLVPNPGFEEYNSCPADLGGIQKMDSFPTVKNWFTPIQTSPDYYNACANPNDKTGVPDNIFSGHSPSHSGNAYAGILVHSVLLPLPENFREYISTQLSQPLIPGITYKLSFFVWLGKGKNNSGINALSTIGAALTSAIDTVPSSFFSLTPQVKNDPSRFLDDTTKWMKIEGYFRATGNENYLTIGNFLNNARSPVKMVLPDPAMQNAYSSYYLIDDVSITEFDSSGKTVDTVICKGSSVTFSKGEGFDSCLWSDGSKSPTHSFSTEGKYWVTNYYRDWMSITDTFIVHVLDPKNSSMDTAFCGTASLKAGPAITYLWNTGETTSSIRINNSGQYWVRKMVSSCTSIDSFTVLIKPEPVIRSLTDTTVCFVQVKQILLDAGTFSSYLWKPTGETSQSIFSTKAQTYLLSVTDSNECTTSKYIAVMETCPDFVFIPNAFTPNADGLNDLFLPQTRHLQFYQMSILNRWGEILFATKNPLLGWDGKNAPADVYVVSIQYQVTGKELQSVSKNITLLR